MGLSPETIMERWLLDSTEAASPVAPLSRQSNTRARCCGKASCASGCALLAIAIAITGCAVYSLVVSVRTTAQVQEMLIAECNITHAEIVAHRTSCTGNGLQRALAPWLRHLHVSRTLRQCYAPQW